MFLSASVGFCALAAIIRAFRGETTLGNFFVDMWRVVVYMFLPVALIFGVMFMQQGMPMTYKSVDRSTTLEPAAMGTDDKGDAKPQTIVVGPVAAVDPDQDARHQRRRLLRHELRPSLREPHARSPTSSPPWP